MSTVLRYMGEWNWNGVPVAMNQAVSSGGRGTDWTLLAAIEII